MSVLLMCDSKQVINMKSYIVIWDSESKRFWSKRYVKSLIGHASAFIVYEFYSFP